MKEEGPLLNPSARVPFFFTCNFATKYGRKLT
jgi:hypothetical protein